MPARDREALNTRIDLTGTRRDVLPCGEVDYGSGGAQPNVDRIGEKAAVLARLKARFLPHDKNRQDLVCSRSTVALTRPPTASARLGLPSSLRRPLAGPSWARVLLDHTLQICMPEGVAESTKRCGRTHPHRSFCCTWVDISGEPHGRLEPPEPDAHRLAAQGATAATAAQFALCFRLSAEHNFECMDGARKGYDMDYDELVCEVAAFRCCPRTDSTFGRGDAHTAVQAEAWLELARSNTTLFGFVVFV